MSTSFIERAAAIVGAEHVLTDEVSRRDYGTDALKRGHPAKWIPPCVLEQYAVYTPVARSSAIVINTYLTAYRVTGDQTYLDRAATLATGLVNAQTWATRNQGTNGEIPTWIMEMDVPVNWLNNSFYAADAVRAVGEALSAKDAESH